MTEPVPTETRLALPTRTLPRSDVALDELIFGTWGLCGGGYGRIYDEQRKATLTRAWELGMRSFDMAPCWGRDALSEHAVAEQVGTRRAEAMYITRAGKRAGEYGLESDFSAAALRASCEASLARLHTDRIDVWLLHNPSEEELGRDETRATAEALKREGKLRAWGASVSSESDARAALAAGVEVLCLPFNLLTPRVYWDLEAACTAQGVGVLARSVLLYGMLAGRFGASKRFGPEDHRAQRWSHDAVRERVRQTNELRDHLSGGPALNVLSLSLRFAIAQPGVTGAIVGPRTPQQVETLLNAVEGERPALPAEQLTLLRHKVQSF
jgi:aryl-alcohol dehydrogenase-like predicted oxidoreductase